MTEARLPVPPEEGDGARRPAKTTVVDDNTGSRWMGVGRSSATDSSEAAAQACRQALLAGDGVVLLIVFAGVDHDPVGLLHGLAAAAPGVPMIGCSTQGELGPGGPADGSVVVTALGGQGFSVSTSASATIDDRHREAGADVALCAEEVHSPYRVLMLLTDGLARDQETVLRGAYGVLGAAVPLFGGAAADGQRMSGTFQLHGSPLDGYEVFTNGVVAACIGSVAPLGIGVRHGWSATGEPMVVTHTSDGRVNTLDDEPALDVYLHRLGAPPEVYESAAAMTGFVVGRPLGVQRRSRLQVRNVSAQIDFEGRSIGGSSALAVGSLAWVLEGDEASILAASRAACRDAVEPLGGRPLVGLIAVSCASCRAVLGHDGVVREVSLVQEAAGGAPYAGFYGYGEIARTRGIDGFHNQATVVLAIS